MDCSLPGSSVRGIFQARVLEWGAIAFSSDYLACNLNQPLGFLYSSIGKASACNTGDLGSVPGLGSSPGEGNDNPLQYSYLENPMKRGVQQATVQRAAESDRTEANKERCDKFLVVFQRWIR